GSARSCRRRKWLRTRVGTPPSGGSTARSNLNAPRADLARALPLEDGKEPCGDGRARRPHVRGPVVLEQSLAEQRERDRDICEQHHVVAVRRFLSPGQALARDARTSE